MRMYESSNTTELDNIAKEEPPSFDTIEYPVVVNKTYDEKLKELQTLLATPIEGPELTEIPKPVHRINEGASMV